MRREWINESKPQDKSEAVSSHIKDLATVRLKSPKVHGEPCTSSNIHQRLTTPIVNDLDDDDLYSATPRNPHQTIEPTCTKTLGANDLQDSLFVPENEADSLPFEDGSQALLAEDGSKIPKDKSNNETHPGLEDGLGRLEVEFEDEMEAMVGMDNMW